MKLRDELKNCSRLVIKVGSNVVTKKSGRCDVRRMRIIVEDICELIESGIEVILVSSGSVNVGKAFLQKMLPREGKIDLQQSASSIGQPKLINQYSKLFEDHHYVCSQILLTHDDIRSRKRFLHAKQTIDVLLKNKVTPILNENDSISFTEITVGDNDHLAASVAQMVNADALVIITSAKGLYDRDPDEEGATLIKHVPFGESLTHIDMTNKTSVGRGGMASKIHAVSKVTPLGIKAIIASKDNSRIVMDPLTQKLGTFFDTKSSYDPELRKAWLISARKLNCCVNVDKGAYKALVENNSSLFAAGIISCEGEFFQGDCIDIRYNGKVFAVGLSEYHKADIDRIKDKHSDEIIDLLGFKSSNEVIHTANLLLIEDEFYGNISTEI